MYLSKLEILGFKSFAQKTVVTFNEGVTSIVGPNGCGKTNIVDAIRWCLGEQKSSALRSDKMENVIFNGTANKKPMGMAEVSLTIQNSKNILPTEYSEVTITRRIFRSGESEYLLNKNLCRLKDITNLFMDTGIGANAYSVIELKMIENILSNKAEERRTMFEEAAGVNKYKLRRRLSLNKLDSVRADLTRVNDIVSEVEKKVRSLERQAKKADKYNRVSASLRELEIDLAERELALFNIQKNEFKNIKEVNQQKKIELGSEINRLNDLVESSKTLLKQIERQLSAKRIEINEITEKIYGIQSKISVNKERQYSLNQNIEKYEQELEELYLQIDEAKNFIETNKNSISELEEKILEKTSERDKVALETDAIKIKLDEKQTELTAHSELLLSIFKNITKQENELSNLQKQLLDKKRLSESLDKKIQNYTNIIAKTVGFIEDLTNEKLEAENKLEETEKSYSEKQREKEELEKNLNRLREQELERKSALNNLKDKISFIQNLINNLEGVSQGAKILLEDGSWSDGEKNLLANIGNTEDQYRFAIEAALKNNLNDILVESIDELKRGIERLVNTNSGKASFMLMDSIDENNGINSLFKKLFLNRKLNKLKKEPGFVGWAYNFVNTDTAWKKFFYKLLGNIAVVNSLDTAFSLSKKYKEFGFVTLNGDYFDSLGRVYAGSLPRLDDTIFGRKKLLDDLKSKFPELEKSLFDLSNQISEVEKKISKIDLRVISEQGKLLVNDIANIEKQIAQFEFEKNKASDEIEKHRTEIQNLADECVMLDNKISKVNLALSEMYADREEEEKNKERLESEFKSIQEQFGLLSARKNALELELERLGGEKKNTINAINRAEQSIVSLTKTIEKRKHDISNSKEEFQSLANIIEEKSIELDDLEEKKTILNNEKNEIQENFDEEKTKIDEKEKIVNRLRSERDKISDELHSADMKLSELSIKTANLFEHIKENYSVTLEQKLFDDLDNFNFEERRTEVNKLKQEVRNLGPINLLAYSEFEEEKERFEFLNKQRNDLLESEKDLIKTIEEINSTAQTLFLETFEKIRGHFVNIFRGLFNPGDEADLKLEEGKDPLEAKIEIIAKPKGKRPTSIELLSGGEKTLTAIALLFAIYLVKPSPFCILDEIDAPLDDANIDRFCKIIKDFSKDTQFIVVTHNKRTMEAASTLYGVTMQEEGISKLVSVRFNEELSFASE